MKVGLIDVDGHHFPNLALMKLSAYHKLKGDHVEFIRVGKYDITYASKVFTYTSDYWPLLADLGKVIKGGTGYNYSTVLEHEIEHIMPDYSLYNETRAIGFLTRGCPNKCSWCVVPKKEGDIKSNADITEFWNGQKEAILLDNNVLASDWGLKQIEKIIDLKIKVDFNQGLDARIIADNKDIADLLSRVKWIRFLRTACDTKSQMPYIEKALDNLSIKPYKMFVYVLVKDVSDALERVEFLRNLGVDVFAQPYIDFSGKKNITREQRRFANWVNRKVFFKTVKWEDFNR